MTTPKVTVKQLLAQAPGAKVHKSFSEAISDITESLEKQHYDITDKLKAQLKARAADGTRRK